MTYVMLPQDNRKNIWAFGYDDGRGHHLHDVYRPYLCSNCGRIDEQRALAEIGPQPVAEKLCGDAVFADDGPLLVTGSFIDIYSKQGFRGLQFGEMVGANDCYVASPTISVTTDWATSGLVAQEPYGLPFYLKCGEKLATADLRCVVCMRHFGVTGFPKRSAMHIPSDPLCFFTTNIQLEHQHCRHQWVFVSDDIRKALKSAKLRRVAFAPLR